MGILIVLLDILCSKFWIGSIKSFFQLCRRSMLSLPVTQYMSSILCTVTLSGFQWVKLSAWSLIIYFSGLKPPIPSCTNSVFLSLSSAFPTFHLRIIGVSNVYLWTFAEFFIQKDLHSNQWVVNSAIHLISNLYPF